MKQPQYKKCIVHLPVKDLQETLAYYKDKLGFSDEWTFGPRDGGIQKHDLRLLFTEDPVFATDINNEKHRLPLVWFVCDIHAIYEDFLQRGIKLADELRPHPYGLNEFAFIDINGYYIRICEETDLQEKI
jgi:hypothetical protein